MDYCSVHPSANVLKLIQPMYEDIIQGCKACCHSELLGATVNPELEVTELSTSDGTYSVCLVWRKVNTMEIEN